MTNTKVLPDDNAEVHGEEFKGLVSMHLVVVDLSAGWGDRLHDAWVAGKVANLAVTWVREAGLAPTRRERALNDALATATHAVLLIGPGSADLVRPAIAQMSAQRNTDGTLQALMLRMPNAMSVAKMCEDAARELSGWLQYPQIESTDGASVWRLTLHMLGLATTEARPRLQVIAGGLSPPLGQPIAPTVSQPVFAPLTNTTNPGDSPMTTLNDSLANAMQIDGALAVALVDYGSGMLLAKAGGAVLNLDAAAAGNTEVVKAKMKTMASLGLKDTIEDILITLGTQYHLIRLVPHKQGLFLYLVLEKARANLALARFKLMEVEKTLTV